MKRRLLQLSRLRNRYLLPIDLVIISISPVLALFLRMESVPQLVHFAQPLAVFIVVQVIAKPVVFHFIGIYSQYWRYASTEELLILVRAIIVLPIVEVLFFFLVMRPFGIVPQDFPRSIPFADSFISISLIGGIRLGIRLVNSWNLNARDGSTLKPALVVGAGKAGSMIVREMQANQGLGLEPMGYVDDDPDKIGKRIHGVRVLGTLSGLPTTIKRRHIAQVIIAMPTASGKTIRNVVQACKESGVESKIIPGLYEILRGTARVDQFRNIELEDLLRRGTVKTDTTSVLSLLHKSRVMVTGAGGSIGSELCRQITDFGPSDLILLGHGENSIFQIVQELLEHPKRGVTIHPVIADVRNRARMEQVFAQYAPQVVFHAAAHKHVPLMEDNVPEAITNNVGGTHNLVSLCAQFEIARFVMISSDKAVNPTSVMGASKRIAELIVQETAIRERKAYVVVRFGNVLGSRGSVVPVFKRQIQLGGPITVTHPEMKRYFMTIPESVQLVLQAATMGIGGETFVLDMGEQIKVVDIARDLIRLNGLEEGRDIDIIYTGPRQGEKLFEELFYEEDRIDRTEHEKIMVCRPKAGIESLDRMGKGSLPMRQQVVTGYKGYENPHLLDVKGIIEAAHQGSVELVLRMLKTLVPQFESPVHRIDVEELPREVGEKALVVGMRSRLDGLEKTDRV